MLQKQLFMAITAPGGNSKLYKAMKFAVKNFFEHRVDFTLKNVEFKQIYIESFLEVEGRV